MLHRLILLFLLIINFDSFPRNPDLLSDSNFIGDKNIRISLANNHLKIVLGKKASDFIMENEDYEDYDGAFISVTPTTGVGAGCDVTFDPKGINYIPLRRIFENNNGDGEVIVMISNGENNNSIFGKIAIQSGNIKMISDFILTTTP